jgi:type IV secretory pathway TraG/TraD family ATPase VirD4
MSPREAHRRPQPGTNEGPALFMLGVIALVFVVALLIWGTAMLNSKVGDLGSPNPFVVIGGVLSGKLAPEPLQIIVLIVASLVLAVLAAGIVLGAVRRRGSGSRIDYKGRSMAQSRDLAELLPKQAAKDAERLNASHTGAGSPLGAQLGTNKPLRASYEWVQIWLMGPRAGKTSCVCVPQILETAGPVVATSNKRDIVDLTRGPRSMKGNVYVHDVQNIIGEPPTWWWNPLSFITDYESAAKLADIFISASTEAGATQDAYFKGAAKETLTRLFLAAAVAGRPITDVFEWSNNPHDEGTDPADSPIELLKRGGYEAHARALVRTQQLPEKQLAGVYDNMRTWITVLGNEKVLPWIVDDGTARPHFNPETFVTSTDTLYGISMEGEGSARAITGALTMAVLTAAERIGSRQPGGRLATPLMAVLDEAANVCRWRALPDVYSHYGSRGIIISSFFQSWSQGVEAFGENGMSKLWSAANIRVVGRGLSEDRFLPFISNLIGDHDVVKRSSSTQKHGRSVGTSIQRERIFDTSDIASLPGGRAILLASGIPAALIKLVHWSEKDYGDLVNESQNYYEKKAARIAAGAETR